MMSCPPLTGVASALEALFEAVLEVLAEALLVVLDFAELALPDVLPPSVEFPLPPQAVSETAIIPARITLKSFFFFIFNSSSLYSLCKRLSQSQTI